MDPSMRHHIIEETITEAVGESNDDLLEKLRRYKKSNTAASISLPPILPVGMEELQNVLMRDDTKSPQLETPSVQASTVHSRKPSVHPVRRQSQLSEVVHDSRPGSSSGTIINGTQRARLVPRVSEPNSRAQSPGIQYAALAGDASTKGTAQNSRIGSASTARALASSTTTLRFREMSNYQKSLPGPGSYSPETVIGMGAKRKGKTHSSAFRSKERRFQFLDVIGTSLGPGQYNINDELLRIPVPAHSFVFTSTQKRFNTRRPDEFTPSPATYDPTSHPVFEQPVPWVRSIQKTLGRLSCSLRRSENPQSLTALRRPHGQVMQTMDDQIMEARLRGAGLVPSTVNNLNANKKNNETANTVSPATSRLATQFSLTTMITEPLPTTLKI